MMNKEAISQLKTEAQQFTSVVKQIELNNEASRIQKERLEAKIQELIKGNEDNREALDIATHAIEILRQVSDEAVGQAELFLQDSLNTALAKMFRNTTRKIEIKEYIRSNQYPQLELVLHVGNGKTRSLKDDSGHGIEQIISLLSVLSLIVITGSRRILVMDEIISGVAVENRKVIDDILWTFTEIGFQFIVNEHGFVPKGSQVYYLKVEGDVSSVADSYIATKGVYLQGDPDKVYGYSNTEHDRESTEEDNTDNLGEIIEPTEPVEQPVEQPVEPTSEETTTSSLNNSFSGTEVLSI